MKHNPDAEYDPEVEAEHEMQREQALIDEIEAERKGIVDSRAAAPPYKVQVIADSSGEWCSNGLAFASVQAAVDYAGKLFDRWTAVRDWRVVASDGAVVSTMGGFLD